MTDLYLSMTAEPVIPAWEISSKATTSGAELQRAIISGFPEILEAPKTFTFKEHGEFFRGALTLAKIRYSEDFYELLRRYGAIRVTIIKESKDEK